VKPAVIALVTDREKDKFYLKEKEWPGKASKKMQWLDRVLQYQ
jgi:hypothetical protein